MLNIIYYRVYSNNLLTGDCMVDPLHNAHLIINKIKKHTLFYIVYIYSMYIFHNIF